MSLRTQLAYLAAGLTLVLGLLGLLNPILTLRLTGLEVIEPRGLGQARALFGALFLTMGGYMLWALSVRPRGRAVLRFTAFLWLASALGRLVSLLLDGPLSLGSILLLVFDLAVGTGAFLGSTETGGTSARSAKPGGHEPTSSNANGGRDRRNGTGRGASGGGWSGRDSSERGGSGRAGSEVDDQGRDVDGRVGPDDDVNPLRAYRPG
ncbi:MAG: DUF4345 domain-containing protein [Trueperaceae bacterium]